MISPETRITIGNGFALVCGGMVSGILSYPLNAGITISFGMAMGGLILMFVGVAVGTSGKQDAKKSDEL